MTSLPQAQTQRWIIFVLVGLFAACCISTRGVQALVAADRIGDRATVLLEAGFMAGFVVISFVALRAASRGKVRAERIVLRSVPLAGLLASAFLAKTSYVDVSVALNALTQRADGSSTVLVLGPGGRDVRLSGDITEGAATRLAALLDAHPNVERIHLTSDGGLADEGEALRKVISARKLTTFVPDYCVSACTLAFLGGRDRLVMSDARLGFHAPFEEGLFGQTFVDETGEERASYLAAGVAAAFVDEVMKVSPDDIWTPKVERLVEAHVATGIVDRYRFPASDLDGTDDFAGARASVLRNFPLTEAIQSERPRAVDAIAGWYLEAYRKGQSEGEIADHLKSIIDHAATLAMADADDETLVGLARVLIAAMDATDSDETCAEIGRAASLVDAEAVLDDNKTASDLAAKLLTRALREHRTTTPAALEQKPLVQPSPVALAATPQPCAATRAIYAKALALPRRDGAALIREILTGPAALKPAGPTVLSH